MLRHFHHVIRMAQKQDKNAGRKGQSTYGGWDFARDFAGGVFGLLNNGRIFPAFGLLILSLMGLVAWRLPEAELAGLVRDFFFVLRSSFGVMLALFVGSNLMWFWLSNRQKRIYENEIGRLSEIRSRLLHKGADIVQIKDHRSSNGEQKEGYILPDVNGPKSEVSNNERAG